MKTSFRGAAWALLALAPVAYLACTDDASIGTTTLNLPDGSVSPTIDAATAVDAAVEDAGVAPTTVTITAFKESTKLPEPDATIVFYAPDGGVLATVKTDAKGQATHEMPAKGAVTAVLGSASQPRLVSILDVEPGDTLTALDTDGPAPGGSFHFKVTPPATPFPNTVGRRLDFGACSVSVNADGVSDEQNTYCFDPGATARPVVLVALDAGNQPIASTTLADVTPKLDGSATEITFATPWTAIGAGQTVNVASVPKTLSQGFYSAYVNIEHRLGLGGGGLRQQTGITVNADAPSTYSTTFTMPLAGATSQQDDVELVEYRSGPNATISRTTTVRGPVTTPRAFDLANLLPRIDTATLTGTTVPSIAFTSAAPLTSTKGLLAHTTWYIPDVGIGRWLVVAPPTSTTVTPPALPADLASFGPSAATNFDTPLLVGVDGTVLSGYSAVRAAAALLSPTEALRNGKSTGLAPSLPTDGTLSLTAFGPNTD